MNTLHLHLVNCFLQVLYSRFCGVAEIKNGHAVLTFFELFTKLKRLKKIKLWIKCWVLNSGKCVKYQFAKGECVKVWNLFQLNNFPVFDLMSKYDAYKMYFFINSTSYLQSTSWHQRNLNSYLCDCVWLGNDWINGMLIRLIWNCIILSHLHPQFHHIIQSHTLYIHTYIHLS